MKIVFFVHRYWPSIGGVEKYIHELARALLSLGHEVDIVAGTTADGLPESEVHEGVPIHRFPALRSTLRARWWLWRHIRLFRRADVVHVSNTHTLEYFWRMLGPLVDRRKVFLTRHGMSYVYPVPESERRRAVRSLRLAAGVVHDGAFIEEWLGVRPDLCPDQGLSPPADELELVPEPPPTSAIYIGRVEPDSGIRIYIDALRILTWRHGRTLMLHVYGDGSLAPELQREVERDSLPVHFHGRTENAQRHITDSCFAFIDGRMAMQEAMARRRLVFSSYVDPLKRDYVCGETFSPYLVAVANGEELAEKVAYYIDHPEARAAMVSRAYEHARTLTWQRTAEAYLGLWQERLVHPRPACSRWKMLKLVLALNRETRLPKDRWALSTQIPARPDVGSDVQGAGRLARDRSDESPRAICGVTEDRSYVPLVARG
jgi:glycosyltransferase involved in cell wall biosynthesis